MTAGIVCFSAYHDIVCFSAYHENCMPRQNAATQASLGGPGPSGAQVKACDVVTQDKIWKQSVASERRCLQNW